MSAKPLKAKRTPLLFSVIGDGSSNEASDIRSRLKSVAEIEEFSMPEGLPELERVAQLLDSRNELQCLAGVAGVARAVPDFGTAAFVSLFKRFNRAVQRGDADLQREAANTLVKVLPEVNDSEFLTASCIPFIQKMIQSQNVTQTPWVEALIVAAIAAADRPSLTAVTAFALQCSRADQSCSMRQTACRLLSWLCTVQALRPNEMAEILGATRLLCQDIDKEVRAAMTTQLAAIAGRLDAQAREQIVVKEIFELVDDEEIIVKVAAFTAFVEMIPSLALVMGFDRILAGVVRLYKEAESASSSGLQASLRLEAARLLGLVLQRIALSNTSVAGPHVTYLLDLYVVFVQDPLATIRRHCAYNLPAVTQFCSRGPHSIYVQSTLISLISDTDADVRCTIACGFHELVGLVTRDRLTTLLKPCFFKLLKDCELRVQIAIVAHIDEIVAALRKSEGHPEPANFNLAPRSQNAVADLVDSADTGMCTEEQILRHLLEYEAKLDLRWREREILFRKLGKLCSTLSPELILRLWKDTILQTMHSEARPVQMAAASTLVVLMLHQTRWVTRIEICQHLINDFCQSASSTDRLLFLYVCPIIAEHFSRQWYRDRILDNAISLCDDDVAIVRTRACLLLPEHRRQLSSRPSIDDQYSERCTASIQMLDKVTERLSADSNHYVKEAARAMLKNAKSFTAADSNYESVDLAKEVAEEAVFHDDCSNFSADFFKMKKSVSMSSLGDPVVQVSLKKGTLSTATNAALKAKAKTRVKRPGAIATEPPANSREQMRKDSVEATKASTDTVGDLKQVKIPTLPTRLIGSVKSTKQSHFSIHNGKKR